MGVNHPFKEKKHRRERPMKNKIMKGPPKKNRNRRNLSSLSYRTCPKRTIIYKADIVVVLIKLKKSGNAYLFHSLLYFSCEVCCPGKELWPTRYVP